MKRLAAKRIKDVLEFLGAIKVPKEQKNQRSALTLLALADLKPEQAWSQAGSPLRGITEMMTWMAENYDVHYAPNTRETIRRQTIHQFVQQGILMENPDDRERPINSPKWCYQLTESAFELIQSIASESYPERLAKFLDRPESASLEARHRDLPQETVVLPDGVSIKLSAGGQNTLIASIVATFIPRFVRSPKVLLLGDAADKEVVSDESGLEELGILLPKGGKSPDVLVHDRERDWLIVIEAVTSHGPVDQKRKNELEELLRKSRPGLVFVSAFPDRKTFSKFQSSIAWETEVWVAEAPDHMIHFNGERFLGPYKS